MIGSTLQFVTSQLNQFICHRLQIDPSSKKIVLSSLMGPDGSVAKIEENVLVLSLVSIRKDAVAYSTSRGPEIAVSPTRGETAPVYVKRNPPIHLNLEILISANFNEKQMQSGLDVLTLAIAFLQGNPLWNAQRFPGFPAGVSDLAFEMETLDFDQIGHLWGAIGANYMPSAVYKVRLITIDDDGIDTMVPGVQIAESRVGGS